MANKRPTDDDLDFGDDLPGNVPEKEVVKIVVPGKKHPTLRILLEDNQDIPPNGLFVGYNGHSYIIPTGVWVDVPMPIVQILNDAIMGEPQRDASKKFVSMREKMRFPYRTAPGQSMAV